MRIGGERAPGRRAGIELLLAATLLAAMPPAARAATPAAPGAGREGPARAVTPARVDSTALCLLPAGPPVPLEAFGTVLWRKKIELGAFQALTIGNLYYGPGSRVDLGVMTGRYRDRVYVRTDRRLLKEWKMPAAGLPDSAVTWAAEFARRFETTDSLFVDIAWGSQPRVVDGAAAGQLAGLFERWAASGLTAEDRALAARLGIPANRFTAPPEPACPPGGG
jgi:hypothetical protein